MAGNKGRIQKGWASKPALGLSEQEKEEIRKSKEELAKKRKARAEEWKAKHPGSAKGFFQKEWNKKGFWIPSGGYDEVMDIIEWIRDKGVVFKWINDGGNFESQRHSDETMTRRDASDVLRAYEKSLLKFVSGKDFNWSRPLWGEAVYRNLALEMNGSNVDYKSLSDFVEGVIQAIYEYDNEKTGYKHGQTRLQTQQQALRGIINSFKLDNWKSLFNDIMKDYPAPKKKA